MVESSVYEDREQTAVKHEILERYLKAFVPIVGDWASDIAYVDCLAGPWGSVEPNHRDTSFGRAVSVLRDTREILKGRHKFPTMRCLFIEKDPQAFQQLKRYSDGVSGIELTTKQWDFTQHVQDIARFARERNNTFPFVFIDPTGWEAIGIDLIRPILVLSPGEVLINLMTSFIIRFLGCPEKRFHELFGADWPKLAQLTGEQKEEAVVRSYAEAVRKAGQFKYVCTLPVMKPSQDSFHFHMMYATRHIKGVEVFKETEKHVIPFMHEARAAAQDKKRFSQTGQYSFLPPEDRYKETCFTRYRGRSLDTAKLELQKMLQESVKVSYDDAWATAMQHSTVLEDDLRGWLEEWEEAGVLEITNQRPRQRFPRRDSGQWLIWKKGAGK